MDISVVIPLYNKKDTIERALRSVFAQTYQPKEIIVVNDGSTDGSEKIVKKIDHPKVRLINQENRGVSAARNRGIETAKCEWIAFLDADDEWDDGYLECLYTLKEKFPECSILATAYYLKYSETDKQKIKLQRIPFKNNNGILSNYFEVACHSHPPVWSSAVCVRKELLTEIGGFPVGIISGEDLLTWAYLALRSPVAYSVKPMASFWQDSRSQIPTRIPDPKDTVGKRLIELQKSVPPEQTKYFKRYIAHWYKMRSNIYLRLGERNALNEIFKGLRFHLINYKLHIFFLIYFLPHPLRLKVFKFLSA